MKPYEIKGKWAKMPEREWQVRQDSNLQPSVLETDALPIELLTYTPSP